MSIEVFLALLTFAFVSSVTPGPNNMMLMASGVNFGFRRTIPHMLGIGFGFLSLLLGVGFGLGALLTAFPAMKTALEWASAAYLLWLAWKIGSSRSIGNGQNSARPMSFKAAALFQWVNPKAWAMALTAMGAYTSAAAPILSVFVVGMAFAIVNLPSVSVWAGFGVALRNWLADPGRLRAFNIAMGILLGLTVIPILRH